jgi:hypothetical protein
MRLIIATPFYDMHGWSNYIASLAHTLLYLQKFTLIQTDFWAVSGDSYIERARNTLTNKFLESDYTHFLFIDSDMGWTPEGVLRLALADQDVVGAGFPCKNNWDFYGCKLNCNEDGIPIVNDKGLISTWNVPTGFCMIKKEVFKKMSEAFPDNFYVDKVPGDTEPKKYFDFFGHYFRQGRDYRDDVYFCRKWASIGGEIWVEPRITLSHAGYKEYVGNYDEVLKSYPGGINDSLKNKIRIKSLKDKHKGKTCYIVGTGPSISNINKETFDSGCPIITLNDVIEKVEVLDLANPVYAMQKDGGGYLSNKCTDTQAAFFPRPQKATLLVHAKESIFLHDDYSPRIIFDNETDFNLPWNAFSAIIAINIAKLMGCSDIIFIGFDAITNGNTARFKLGDDMSSAGYLEQAAKQSKYLETAGIKYKYI